MAEVQYHPSVGVWIRLPGILLLELVMTDKLSSYSLLHSNESRESMEIFIDSILTVSLYMIAIALVVLPVNILKLIHLHVLWLVCIASCHYIYLRFMKMEIKLLHSDHMSSDYIIKTNSGLLFTTVLTQLALCFAACLTLRYQRKFPFFLSLLPLATWILYFNPKAYLHHAIQTSVALSLVTSAIYANMNFNIAEEVAKALLKFQLWKHIFGWRGIISMALREFEFSDLLMWAWLVKVSAYVVISFVDPSNDNFGDGFGKTASTVAIICFLSMVKSTENFLSLIGIVVFMCRAIKLQFFLIRSWLNGSFFHHAPDPVDVGSASFVDGLTMMTMSIYVEVADLDFTSRAFFMMYIFLTIFSSQVRTIYTIVDAFLITLATVQTASFWKHLRACFLAFSLVLICFVCSYGVVKHLGVSRTDNIFWMVVITHNFIATIALTMGSVLIYIFMLLDNKLTINVANIDDVVFYVRGLSEFFEFILTIVVSVFVMSNLYNDVRGIPGGDIVQNDSNTLNLTLISFTQGTILLAFYNYYNLMTKGKNGWRAWKMRRGAGEKVRSLREAGEEERRKIDDVCSICYQDLKPGVLNVTVRIMHCGHPFHENCLKKWFQIQDKCPICHKDFNEKVVAKEEIKEETANVKNDPVEETTDTEQSQSEGESLHSSA